MIGLSPAFAGSIGRAGCAGALSLPPRSSLAFALPPTRCLLISTPPSTAHHPWLPSARPHKRPHRRLHMSDSEGDTPASSAEEPVEEKAPSPAEKARKKRKRALLAISALATASTFSLPYLFNACPPSLVTLSVSTHCYLWLLQRLRFREVAVREREQEGGTEPLFTGNRSWIQAYSAFMGVGGLVIPWILCLNNPDKYFRLLGPHLYLLMYQVVLEAASKNWAKPVRLLVPIAFNSFRIPQLERWRSIVFDPFAQFTMNAAKDFSPFDKAFCTVSCLAWTLNLFVFLIPFVYTAMLDPKHQPPAKATPSGNDDTVS